MIEPKPGTRGHFLKILFEGTTSHNSGKEILAAFEQVARWPESPQTCTFYQGCGCDLITLACSTVDTHILSDISPDVLSQLDGKFRQLADGSFIHELRKDGQHWRFVLDGRAKDVHFNEMSLEALDVRKKFGNPLGVVFEWNCDDCARKESFWQAISREMVQGGQVIGSYAPDLESLVREAFVLDTNGREPMLSGYEDFADVQGDERDAVIARARELGEVPNRPHEKKILEIGSQIYRLDRAGHDRLSGQVLLSVTRVWRQPIGAFGLKLISAGNKICRLRIEKRDRFDGGGELDGVRRC